MKNLPANADVRDVGSIPGSGRSLREQNGYPLWYSCLGKSMDRGAWWATVHGAAESDVTEHNNSDNLRYILNTTIWALNHFLLMSYSSPPIQWTSAGMCKAWRWIQTNSYLTVIYRGQAFPWISTQSVRYVLILLNTSSYTGNFFNNKRLDVAKLGLIFQVWIH